MMTINRNNFEAYLLDYLEGNLDPLLTADLMAFLAEHPEFERFIPDYNSNLSLSDSCAYGDTTPLKKDYADVPAITADNFDEFCVAACEDLLGESDNMRLSQYILQHPDKQQDLDLYRQIRLKPDPAIRFPGKAGLRKKQGRAVMRYLFYATGIAASLVLVYLLVNRKPGVPEFPVTGTVAGLHPESTLRPSGTQANTVEPPQEQAPAKIVQNATPFPAGIPAATPEIIGQAQVLAALEPIPAGPVSGPDVIPLVAGQHHGRMHPEIPGESPADESRTFTDSFLGTLLNRVNIWKTAETAVAGFNYLTESQLSVARTTDESGKLTGLLIAGESYTITGGKIK